MVRATKARLERGIYYTEWVSIEIVPAKIKPAVFEKDPDTGENKIPLNELEPAEIIKPALTMEFEVHPLSESQKAEILETTDIHHLSELLDLDKEYVNTFTDEEKQNPAGRLMKDGKLTGKVAATMKRQAMEICRRGLVDPEIAALATLPWDIPERLAKRIEEISTIPVSEVEDFLRRETD